MIDEVMMVDDIDRRHDEAAELLSVDVFASLKVVLDHANEHGLSVEYVARGVASRVSSKLHEACTDWAEAEDVADLIHGFSDRWTSPVRPYRDRD